MRLLSKNATNTFICQTTLWYILGLFDVRRWFPTLSSSLWLDLWSFNVKITTSDKCVHREHVYQTQTLVLFRYWPFRVWTLWNVAWCRRCPQFFYSSSALLAMQRAVIARVILSVRLSVCSSVTFRYCVQTNEDTIVRFSASGRTILLVSEELTFIRIFAGITASGVKMRHSRVDNENLTNNRP